MENGGRGSRRTGYGVRGTGYGVRGTGYGVWGTGSRVVENTGSGGKHGVWKTRGLVENSGSGGKHRVSVENTGSKCKTQAREPFRHVTCDMFFF